MLRTRSLILFPVAAALVLGGCSSGGTGSGSASGSGSSAGSSSSSGSSAASSAVPTSSADANPIGDIPDNQVYVPYRPADGSFTVDVPEGWARSDRSDGVSFTDKLNTVSAQELTGRSQPTPDSVRSGELQAISAAGRHLTVGAVKTEHLPAGDAVHVSYSQDSVPDPVTQRVVRDDVELFVFWRGGTEALLTLSGPHGADNVDPWKKISTSFSWK